ncbi:UNVERIFIED_CONTAM: hypothetical protein ABID98_003484 [Brevibacillus sp. OAP136]
MANEKTSKDFELDDLEKPLTEQEMKETTGGEKENLASEIRVPVVTPPPVFTPFPTPQSGGAGNGGGQFVQPPMPAAPAPIIIPVNPNPMQPPPIPFTHSTPAEPKVSEPVAIPILKPPTP